MKFLDVLQTSSTISFGAGVFQTKQNSLPIIIQFLFYQKINKILKASIYKKLCIFVTNNNIIFNYNFPSSITFLEIMLWFISLKMESKLLMKKLLAMESLRTRKYFDAVNVNVTAIFLEEFQVTGVNLLYLIAKNMYILDQVFLSLTVMYHFCGSFYDCCT